MKNELKTLPKGDFKDLIYNGIAAGIGAIPHWGPAYAVLFGAVFTKPLEQKTEAFLKALVDQIVEVEKTVDKINNLVSSESFVASTAQAVTMALMTVSEEKRQALRNAVINSVKMKPSEDERLKYFITIQQLTPAHMRLLSFFADPYVFATVNSLNFELPTGMSSTIPAKNVMRGYEPEFVDILIRDLSNAGLLFQFESSITVNSGQSFANNLTNYGKKFYEFVSAPSATTSDAPAPDSAE